MNYYFLVILRVILVCIPQLGYIHPDEYFQSVEVLSAKFLNIQTRVPWEFNTSFPIRSMTIPYFTMGISYKILLLVDYFVKEYFAYSLITTYFVLLFPRLLMCLSSFLVDYSLHKICVNNNEKCTSRSVILASSYVILIYGTRTFSNTIELILFALLLYYVAESLTFTNSLIRKKEYINYRYSTTKNVVEKVKLHKLQLFLKTDTLRNCPQISTLVVAGFFNRPTFLAFAVLPVFFWIYRGIGSKCVQNLHFHLRIFTLIIYSIPTLLLFTIIDSFYYGYITWGEIGMFDVTINKFVFTPLNFLKYNSNNENLAQHGIHPRYLNLLVNMPLLFNVLAVFNIYTSADYLYRIVYKKFNQLPTVRSIKGLMFLSIITPLSIMSMFPHQEPRFLIPLIVPMVYLYGPKLVSEHVKSVVEAETMTANSHQYSTKKNSKICYHLWLTLNAVSAIFYGFLHQGGVFPTMSFLSAQLKENKSLSSSHIFSAYTYSLPESLLLKHHNRSHDLNNFDDFQYQRLIIHEEGSIDLPTLLGKIRLTYAGEEANYLNGKRRLKVFVILPTSLHDEFSYLSMKETFKLVTINTFYPHLSLEALPNIGYYCLDIFNIMNCKSGQTVNVYEYFSKAVSLCGLRLYEVT